MIEIIVFILVTVYLYISYKSLMYNYITVKAYFNKQSYFMIVSTAFIILGIILGIIFAVTQYKINQRYTAISIPLPAAFFEYENGKIIDYVNPLAFPIIVINFFIGVGSVQITESFCLLLLKRKFVKARA